MKQNEVEMVLEPSIGVIKPAINSQTEMVARPTGVAQSVQDGEKVSGGFRKRKINTVVKVFCAPRDIALALLEDFIIMAGAHNDVMEGKTTETQNIQISTNTQKFLIDLSDRLMVDCGLNEDDIKTIVMKLDERIKSHRVDQSQPLNR